MKKIFLFINVFALIVSLNLKAQVTVGAEEAPVSGALLQLKNINGVTDDGTNANKGFELPRVNLSDANNLFPMFLTDPANPASGPNSNYSVNKATLDKTHKGLMVYNINAVAPFQQGIYLWDGTKWVSLASTEPWMVSGSSGLLKATLNTQSIYQTGQVGVGISDMIPAIVKFDVVSDTSGIMIPRMTQGQRDAIPVDPFANSLLIYNTTEDCYNYYSRTNGEWQSLCGGMAKAVFTISCGSSFANGVYVKNTGLNGNNYLSLAVNVTKAGNYTITGTTGNGYGFSTQGTFLNTGIQTVIVPGQGQPVNSNPAPGDKVDILLSGAESGCTNIVIPVLPPTATFNLNCGTAVFNGAYVKGKPLTSSNTVTFQVNVSDISTGGTWAVTSNTENGISFNGSGTFTGTGPQLITLQGMGTPTGINPITLKFTTNSGDGASTCEATVSIAIPPMTVLAIGYGSDGNIYNYSVFAYQANADNYKMVIDRTNFGTQDNSTVKFGDGTNTWKVLNPSNTLPDAATTRGYLSGALNPGGLPPDIVIIGFDWGTTQSDAATIQAFVTYLQKGGVLLMFCENITFNAALMNAIFGGGTTISVPVDGFGAGARYQFPLMQNDPVINGPFGNLGGAFWGEDASATATIHASTISSNIAAAVTIYTTESNGIAGAGNITAFRHNSLSWIWVGDGGFNSCADHTSTGICPFYVQQTAPYIPMAKPVQYGIAGDPAGFGPVSNSIFTANALAWGLNQAMYHGVNPH